MPSAPDDAAGRSPAGPLYNTSCEETMSDDPKTDATPTRCRAAFGEAYGDRRDRVVLYGSRALISSGAPLLSRPHRLTPPTHPLAGVRRKPKLHSLLARLTQP